jgi:excisionase family DNA binding protein
LRSRQVELLEEPFGAGALSAVQQSHARDGRTCKALPAIVSSADGDPALISVREVADRLGVHPETIRRLIHDGRLDAVRVGRVLRVHRDAVDRFLALQRVKPSRFQA